MPRVLLALLGLVLASGRALSAPVVAPHVQVELVAERASIQPGHDAGVGLRFALEPGWHVYWRNPGDSGEAPSVAWTLPPGFSAGPIEWPSPERIPLGPLTNFGYEGVALLPVTLRVPADLPNVATVDVHAKATWLVCNRDECIPGSAPLSLRLPVGGAAPGPTDATPLFEATRARLPTAVPSGWQLSADASPEAITLVARGVAGGLDPRPLFFPFAREAIEHAEPQQVTLTQDGFRLDLTPWSGTRSPLQAIAGVLTVGGHAYTIDVAVGNAGLALMPFVLAFVGGLLLNLMPCVFPVLALKALGLVGLAGEAQREVRVHGIVYALGVLVSFWALAGVLLGVRAGGAQLGWGFQLQSPVVIALLATLFFWVALTLLDVSPVGASLMGFGNRLAAGGGYRASFFTGVLATVVATPCTAPFMGTALGYALVQPPAVALGVFTSLGLGLALPYVAITLVPAIGARLPRPGAWTETLKHALAFPLLATVVWLVWVVSLQAGPPGVLAVLSAILLVGLGMWIAGRRTGGRSRLVAGAAAAGALGILATIVPTAMVPSAGGALAWEPYSAERVGEHLRAGRPVFVDFTAAWCVTCQVNERLALATPAVTAKMKAMGVVPMRADWTRPDPDIARALQRFGRDGVPLYVLYTGREKDPPRILPQILTTETVLTELDQLEGRSPT